MTDLRFAIRRLRATPLITLSAVVCLAIGVWMTCIVSAVARGFFHPDLGLRNAHELVQIEERGLFVEKNGKPVCCHWGRVSSKSVVDTLAARRVFAAVGFYSTTGTAPIADGEDRAVNTVIMS